MGTEEQRLFALLLSVDQEALKGEASVVWASHSLPGLHGNRGLQAPYVEMCRLVCGARARFMSSARRGRRLALRFANPSPEIFTGSRGWVPVLPGEVQRALCVPRNTLFPITASHSGWAESWRRKHVPGSSASLYRAGIASRTCVRGSFEGKDEFVLNLTSFSLEVMLTFSHRLLDRGQPLLSSRQFAEK